MKKNALKKLLVAALCGAMTVSMLAGCGAEKTTEPAAPAASTEKQDDVLVSVEPVEIEEGSGIESWKPFDNTVTIQIPVYDRGEDGDETSNYWTQWINDEFGAKYNVNVEFVAIGRGTVLDDYNTLGNAGKLPTVLMEYDFDKCAYWANDGFLAELDLAEFAKVAPTYYQMMVDNNYLQYTTLNGKQFFVLAERPYSDTNYTWVTFYRQDWLDQLGLSYPANWDEWLNLYAKIKDAGLATYPAGGSKVTGAGVDQNYTFRTYPQDEYAWATTGDYAIPALSTEAQKKLLERRNSLYNLGYFDAEFETKEAADADADFVAGKAFQYSTYIASELSVITDFYANNPDAKLAIAPVTASTDDGAGSVACAYRVNNPYGMMVGFASTATEEQKKAAMMYMEWLIQPENLFTFQYGFENETYVIDENGLPQVIACDTDHAMVARQNKDYFCIVIEARKLGTIEETVKSGYPSVYKDSDAFYDQIVANYYTYKDVIAKTPQYAVTDCKFAETLEQAASLQAFLLDQYATYATQLTKCKPEEFSAMYDDLSAKYLNDGYQTVIDERANLYNSGKTSSLPQY